MTKSKKDHAKRILGLLDLTSLNSGDDEVSNARLCGRARTEFGSVAAVCVWPRFVARCTTALRGSAIKVAAVADFPEGTSSPDAAASEAAAIIRDGGDEVDLVLNYRALMAGDVATPRAAIAAVRAVMPQNRTLKVILESGTLADPSVIRRAAELAIAAGADFIKTSTGKTATGATLDAAIAMISAIRDHHAGTGKRVGFKASGGIRTLDEAMSYVEIGERLIGPSFVQPATFRFGASGLLDDLLAQLSGKPPMQAKPVGY